MYQVPSERKKTLWQLLRETSRKRPVWVVGVEWAGVDGVSAAENENVITLSRYRDGAVTHQRLAFCGPHGSWIEWAPKDPEDDDTL
jgi:hypothetical protein